MPTTDELLTRIQMLEAQVNTLKTQLQQLQQGVARGGGGAELLSALNKGEVTVFTYERPESCCVPPPDGLGGPGCNRPRGHKGACVSYGNWGGGVAGSSVVGR